MATLYVNLALFQKLSVVPPADVATVEASRAGYTEARSELRQALLESRLRKRYGDPSAPPGNLFQVPPPSIVVAWIVAMLTIDVWDARGRNPSDPAMVTAQARYDEAEAQIKEAADSVTGLFDLPVNDGSSATGVDAGGPMAYSEQSPYTWTTIEAINGQGEDQGGLPSAG